MKNKRPVQGKIYMIKTGIPMFCRESYRGGEGYRGGERMLAAFPAAYPRLHAIRVKPHSEYLPLVSFDLAFDFAYDGEQVEDLRVPSCDICGEYDE